ncbi:MAG: DUF4232 domain-containing protein [Acidimicrobiales bacterium]|jgi:hypothetical protein
MPSTRSRRALVLCALAATAGLSACSGGGGPSGNSGSTTTTTATTTAASSTTTGSTSTTAASGLTACAARDLAMAVTGSQGAAGTLELTIGVRNLSGTTCPMDGFPSVQLLDGSGAQIPTHVVQGGSYSFTDVAPAALTLAPGASASFNLGYSDVPTAGESTCPTAATMQVFPPHASDADTITVQSLVVCNSGTVTVSPVFVPGSGAPTTAPQQP